VGRARGLGDEVGCRHNAKNTLPKNYLYFAERAGVEILPERTVAEVRPLGAPDGSGGYSVTGERSGAWFDKQRQTLIAEGVVVAAGPLGTNQLLQRCRIGGALPRLSKRVGYLVRSNSEAISAVTTKDDRHDFTKSIAITSSFYPDPDIHIENVTYGPGADSISFLFTVLGKARSKLARPLWPLKWSRRTVILLTMQTLDNSMRLIPKRNLFGPGPRLQTGGSRQAEPALHRGRRQGHPPRGREARRHPAGRPHRAAAQHPDDRAHHGRRGDRRGPGDRRDRPPAPRLRLREPARLRRLGDPRQRRREPQPHDHRDGRARDEPRRRDIEPVIGPTHPSYPREGWRSGSSC
jgi:hypothetical protein